MGKGDTLLNACRKIIADVLLDQDIGDPSEREIRLANGIARLDDWLSRGGDLPDDWKRKNP